MSKEGTISVCAFVDRETWDAFPFVVMSGNI
jgi:hypothetical protein